MAILDSQTQPAGYNLPSFVTDEKMEAFFETQDEYGIPVSTGIAQLIAESGFGRYGPGGESGQGLSGLAYNHRNLFGIKYYSGDRYATGSVDMITGEEVSGGDLEIITAAFSVYAYLCRLQSGSVAGCSVGAILQSYHCQIPKPKRWLLHLSAQANSFMTGIKEAGWATSSSYVTNCINHMVTYNLYQFDNMTWEDYQAGQTPTGGSGFPWKRLFSQPLSVRFYIQ